MPEQPEQPDLLERIATIEATIGIRNHHHEWIDTTPLQDQGRSYICERCAAKHREDVAPYPRLDNTTFR